MKKYNVNVNGTMYEITLEVADAAEVKSAAPQTAAAPQAAAPAAKAPVAQGAETISAPMPGTILSVNVKAGETVSKGTVLFILEAMKLENEIVAPRDCTVSAVNVTKGASVQTGEALCTIA